LTTTSVRDVEKVGVPCGANTGANSENSAAKVVIFKTGTS